MHKVFLLCSVVCAAESLPAQSPDDPLKQFEVVSIKPVQELTSEDLKVNSISRVPHISRQAVRMPYESLAQILRRAFGLPRPQVAAPEWTEFRHFSIDARVPEGASADDVPAMLLSMLSERFHMTYHSEVRNTAVLLLTLAKGGLKAEPSPEQPRPRSWLIGELGRHYEMATTSAGLADFLKQRSSFPVNDTTGLAGSYLFSFDFYPFGKQGADGKYVGLPTGDFLTSQAVRYDEALAPLGLRLTLSKMRLDNIIIDHIDRVPTEN